MTHNFRRARLASLAADIERDDPAWREGRPMFVDGKLAVFKTAGRSFWLSNDGKEITTKKMGRKGRAVIETRSDGTTRDHESISDASFAAGYAQPSAILTILDSGGVCRANGSRYSYAPRSKGRAARARRRKTYYLDDEFPAASGFIQIDTGWREIDGERVGGWHVSIAGGPKALNIEAHSGSFIEAVTQALEKSGLK